ncbi:sortase domain-containing protein [Propionibacteriaceae bacterium G57]|uniref:sortase domain-containing protein n=1 Tax=Aestuariimicrobium sp. G57 TaxID=3418485 RepID=UPI003DA7063B
MPRRRPTALAITIGVILLALVAAAAALGWATIGTDALSRRRADDLVASTRADWAAGRAPAAAPAEGDVIAIIRSADLGIEWPVVVGVAPDQLDHAVGWYPSTGLPGQPGNTALAGYRVTHGAPFSKLLDLPVGSVIVIETAAQTFTYRTRAAAAHVDAGPSGAWVLDPVPGDNRVPTTGVLTLTTAADLVATGSRAVVFAELVSNR